MKISSGNKYWITTWHEIYNTWRCKKKQLNLKQQKILKNDQTTQSKFKMIKPLKGFRDTIHCKQQVQYSLPESFHVTIIYLQRPIFE